MLGGAPVKYLEHPRISFSPRERVKNKKYTMPLRNPKCRGVIYHAQAGRAQGDIRIRKKGGSFFSDIGARFRSHKLALVSVQRRFGCCCSNQSVWRGCCWLCVPLTLTSAGLAGMLCAACCPGHHHYAGLRRPAWRVLRWTSTQYARSACRQQWRGCWLRPVVSCALAEGSAWVPQKPTCA